MLPRHLTKNVTPTTKTLRMWNGAVLNPIGVCRMPVTNIQDGELYTVGFTVHNGNFMPILGLNTSLSMELTQVNKEKLLRVRDISELDTHSDVFDGQLGTLPGIHHFCVSDVVRTVTMPACRVPYRLHYV